MNQLIDHHLFIIKQQERFPKFSAPIHLLNKLIVNNPVKTSASSTHLHENIPL